MADVANRYPENALCRYYVDSQCIDCNLCRQTVPNNFARDEESGTFFRIRTTTDGKEEAHVRKRCKIAQWKRSAMTASLLQRAKLNR
jgi:ferredoxin